MYLKIVNRLTMLDNGIDFDDLNLQTMTTNKFISSCINKRYPVTRYIIFNLYRVMKNHYQYPREEMNFSEYIEYHS